MKTPVPKPTIQSKKRSESIALSTWCWAFISACLSAGNLSAAPITLVNENFDSYAGAATSFSSIAVNFPNTDRLRVEDGLAQGDAPGGLGFNGVQLASTWILASAYNSGNAMLLRPNTAFRCNLNPRGGTNYVWEFSMLSSKSGTADRGFRVSLLMEGADQNATDDIIFRSGQFTTTSAAAITAGLPGVDGVDIIQAFNGFSAASGTPGPNNWLTVSNTAAGTPSFVTNNVWAHYKIEHDAPTRTFKYYVNDMVTPVNAVVYCARPQNLPVAQIRFAHEGNSADDGYTLIDNVSLTVDGTFVDLGAANITEGFEGYAASNSGNTNTADNNPGGAWVTSETSGVNNNNIITPTRVQVVDSSVTAPHGGSKCLMVSQGQTSGSSISWAQATNDDVKITWWAKVPITPNNNAIFSVYLRVSVYAWEANYSAASDTILFGYGHRGALPNPA